MLRSKVLLVLIVLLSLALCRISSGQIQHQTADEVLRRYIEALGGEEKLKSISTMQLIESELCLISNEDQSEVQRNTCTYLRANQSWKTTYSRGTSYAFDGKDYWSKSERSKPRWMAANRYPYNHRDPVAYPLHLIDFPGTIEFAAKITDGGKTLYSLTVEPNRPEPSDRIRMTPKELIFDAETGLLVKIVHEAKTVEISDYREVDGIKVAFQRQLFSEFADLRSRCRVKIESIKFNIPLEERELSLEPSDQQP